MYLIGHRRSCRPHGNRDLRYLEDSAPMRLVSSCKRAERAEPAAERAARPEQHRRRDRGPQDEDQRGHQEIVPTETGHQRVDEGQDVDHGELRLRAPAEPDQRESQESQPYAVYSLGRFTSCAGRRRCRSVPASDAARIAISTVELRQILCHSGSAGASALSAGRGWVATVEPQAPRRGHQACQPRRRAARSGYSVREADNRYRRSGMPCPARRPNAARAVEAATAPTGSNSNSSGTVNSAISGKRGASSAAISMIRS